MIQLQVLSGKLAGSDITVRQFPFLIGRGADAQLRLEEAGVWEKHVQIDFERARGFTFTVQSDALTLINGEPLSAGTLRNGDLLELGSARLRFWLARGRQKAMRMREAGTWGALFLLFAVQLGVVVWLLR